MKLASLLNTHAISANAMISPEFKHAFNKDILLRFYPDSSSKKGHSLIGVNKLAELVEDKTVFAGIVARIDSCEQDRLSVKLRRGIAFTFVIR